MAIIAAVYIVFFILPAVMVAVYYCGLMTARLLGASAKWPASDESRHRFALIIPAHNEEDVIADTLESCKRLDYPTDRFAVFVLADNCTDRTAEIARLHGVHCLERHDPDNPGKGQALEWAFPQVLATACDAVAVIDADCVVDQHALQVFDHCLVAGNPVLQANYVMSNPDASTISYLARIGNVTEYDFFYAPKSDLGLSVTLVGTGMVFRRDILERHPWHATSVTEDTEYTLALTKARVRVRLVSNVAVRQAAAERFDQLRPQRKRWARGTLRLSRHQSFATVLEGICCRNLRLADFGWTLAVLSRPLVLAHLLMTVLVGGLLSVLTTSRLFDGLFYASLAILAAQAVYFAVAVAAVGISWHRILLLLATPMAVLRLIGISVCGALSSETPRWERTPR
jgi:1,2-diacylglycerol 3-beta-glucosyltransferase